MRHVGIHLEFTWVAKLTSSKYPRNITLKHQHAYWTYPIRNHCPAQGAVALEEADSGRHQWVEDMTDTQNSNLERFPELGYPRYPQNGWFFLYIFLVGGLVAINFIFALILGCCHHPN